jgi:hypothetical protein
MAKPGNYQIPFDRDGNQQHWPDPEYEWPEGYGAGKPRLEVAPVWQDNSIFGDVLTFDGYSRGRSAAYFGFTRLDGKKVTMFLAEFTEVVPHMVRGKIGGTFTFVKRGQNYGAKLVEAD